MAFARTGFRQVRMRFEDDRNAVQGMVHVPAIRVSDFMNHERDFIAITNAQVSPLERPEEVEEIEFLLLARRYIRMAIPLEGE